MLHFERYKAAFIERLNLHWVSASKKRCLFLLSSFEAQTKPKDLSYAVDTWKSCIWIAGWNEVWDVLSSKLP